MASPTELFGGYVILRASTGTWPSSRGSSSTSSGRCTRYPSNFSPTLTSGGAPTRAGSRRPAALRLHDRPDLLPASPRRRRDQRFELFVDHRISRTRSSSSSRFADAVLKAGPCDPRCSSTTTIRSPGTWPTPSRLGVGVDVRLNDASISPVVDAAGSTRS